MEEKINQYFLKYRDACRKITIKESELDELHQKTIGSNNYCDTPKASYPKSGLEQKQIQIESVEEQLQKLYKRRTNLKNKHLSDFEKLSKQEYKIILTNYYLDFISLKNISIKLDHSLGYVKKLKRDALNELVDKILKKSE